MLGFGRTRTEDETRREDLRYELSGIGLLAFAFFSYLSLLTARTGAAGTFLVRVLRTAFGEGVAVMPLLLAVVGFVMLVQKRRVVSSGRLAGITLLIFVFSAYLHLPLSPGAEFENAWRGLGGGLTGAVVSWSLLKLFGEVGRYLVLATLTLFAVVLTTHVSVLAMVRRGKALVRAVAAGVVRWVRNFVLMVTDRDEQEATASPPAAPAEREGRDREAMPDWHGFPRRELHGRVGPSGLPVNSDRSRQEKAGTGRAGHLPVAESLPGVAPGYGTGKKVERYEQMSLDDRLFYRLPDVSLLRQPGRGRGFRMKNIQEKARILEETLESFGIKARVSAVSQGPVVTRFELQLAPGVKVSRIMSLTNDLALSLASPDVRIEAPIPGKAAIGVEVPNEEVTLVSLREVIESKEFRQSPSRLTVCLGRDIGGRPVVADLERLLHVLIAGATGSGKSVCLNAIICSILFKARPDEVKFLLIDPKVVEFSSYKEIPHLLAPVVTDPKKAAGSLRWVVQEMERRYEAFASAGVKEIEKFNLLWQEGRLQNGDGPLPYIVVVIDELADLMMVTPVDVEDAIQRLAQMARAAGIHLVVATQRPSVNVITGVIKANIPSRIAFAVSSQVDSRTILDMPGAEKLLGRGDMLFLPVWASKPTRIQGTYVSEAEVDALAAFIRQQGGPTYAQDWSGSAEGDPGPERVDPLFPEAVRLVVESGSASASLLQRKLRIGYTRAARLIDQMEERGFVGRYDGSRPREVLLRPDEYRRLFGPERK